MASSFSQASKVVAAAMEKLGAKSQTASVELNRRGRGQNTPPVGAAPPLIPSSRCQSSWMHGLSYTLNYADEKGKFDEVVEDKGVKILIEPKALMHVIGTKMDFVDDKLRSEFIFVNPNSKGQCGCGESFMTKLRRDRFIPKNKSYQP